MSAQAVGPGTAGALSPPRLGRRVAVLGAAQVLGGVGVASGIAVNGLLAQQLSGSTALAGMAQTTAVLGSALLAVPLARLAQVRGRRPALAAGWLTGAAGAVLSLVAAAAGAFWLLLLGAALFGGGTASGLQARFAAIDGLDAGHRGRVLAMVVWASTVGSVAGPNLSGPGGDLGRSLGLPALAGPYLFSCAAFALSAAVVAAGLRPDPLGAGLRRGGSAGAAVGVRQSLAAVVPVPAALLGLATLGAAHAVMVSVMVMTPVHLHEGGATLQVVGLVISVHIAGMYALSPVMGWVADRFGRLTGVGLGAGLLLAACGLAAACPASAHGWLAAALTLLGLGWSACVVSASALLTESVPAPVRTGVQGLADLTMGLVAAAAGLLAGPVVAGPGYPALAVGATVLLVPVASLAVRARGAAPVAA